MVFVTGVLRMPRVRASMPRKPQAKIVPRTKVGIDLEPNYRDGCLLASLANPSTDPSGKCASP